jgi:hypothetical protein
MKKMISTLVVLAIAGAFCAGCNKTETSTPEESQTKKDTPATKNWEPPTVKQPSMIDADGVDHTGHNHGPAGHGSTAPTPAPTPAPVVPVVPVVPVAPTVDPHAGHDHAAGEHDVVVPAPPVAPEEDHTGHDHAHDAHGH